MVDDSRPDDAGQERYTDDWRYYGPFAPQPGQPADAPTLLPPEGTGPTDPGRARPAVDLGPALPAPQLAPVEPVRRNRGRGVGVILGAGLTALVVGAAAGFGGARLADRPSSTTASPSTAPTPAATTSGMPSATASPISPAPRQIDTVEVAKTVLPSTVMIRVGSGSGGATGSGFVLDAQGHVMTNNHVVADASGGRRMTVVFSDGRRASASLVGRSPSYDLAVIKVAGAGALVPMQVGNSDGVQVGETVVAVGSPLALPGTVTQGIVSAKNRPVVVSTDDSADAPSAYINGIQTDAPINPGNSGGPLIDAASRVIGVNSAILTLGESREQSGNIGLGFAIPINQAMEIGTLLIKDGKATYPIIGADVSSDDGGGVRLTSVENGGPADKAGLTADDVVTAIDGQPVYSLEELIVAVRTHRPGEVVKLAYTRDGKRGSVDVTLGSREG